MGIYFDEYLKRKSAVERNANKRSFWIALLALAVAAIVWSWRPLVSGLVVIVLMNGAVHFSEASGFLAAERFDEWHVEGKLARERIERATSDTSA